jgi:putative toxin-antitoxin system antitoxin component (TIGR02293 family)
MAKTKSEKSTKPTRKRAYVMGDQTFAVVREGKSTSYVVAGGFGYFIPALKKAGNVGQVARFVEMGFRSKEVRPLIDYLEFKVPDIAKAAAVSTSTVSRWRPTTSIGVTGSEQFFKIDEIVRKGVDLFGGEEEFKQWLDNPNRALGNIAPLTLVKTRLGAELVDEALDALDYGDVI